MAPYVLRFSRGTMLSRQSLVGFRLFLLLPLLAALAGCGRSGQEQMVQLIPREVLFGNPSRVSPQLSPDGRHWSYRAPVNDVMNVWVATVGADDARPVTADSMRGIQDYFWGADSKHILYFQDDGGNENWRLCAVDIDTRELTCLTPFQGVQVYLIDRNKRFPNQLLIAMNKDNPQWHDVYRLDIVTGALEKVAANPGKVAQWISDVDFNVRGAVIANDEGGFDLLVRPGGENTNWKTVVSWGAEDAVSSDPLGFSKDGEYMYLIDSRRANAGRLTKLELASGKYEVVAEDSQYDISDVELNPDTRVPEWAVVTRERDIITVLDESVRDDIEALQKLQHGDLFLVSRDDADKTWLVGFKVDNGPIPYYSWDRVAKHATFLFYHRPELKKYTLASMEPFSFVSRDSLTIHGYLTFPPGLERRNLPTVVKVHGGPWWRDLWGYDSEVQWLANRGYLCVQVNFRGSTGYGKKFVNAGDREWGGKMHNDVIDAVNWVVAQGYADRDRVAIYGSSFGGYEALVGATFTPDVFCCAIDLVGVSDLVTFIESVPPYWSAYLTTLYERVGHPVRDREFLKSRSPLYKADKIKIPVLVAQGANDSRVKQSEAEEIVNAMKANGVVYEYLLFQDEGHGLVRPENRTKFYSAAERFLAKYLGGRYEEAPVKQ